MRLPVASEFEFAAHTMGLRKYHNRVGSIYYVFNLGGRAISLFITKLMEILVIGIFIYMWLWQSSTRLSVFLAFIKELTRCSTAYFILQAAVTQFKEIWWNKPKQSIVRTKFVIGMPHVCNKCKKSAIWATFRNFFEFVTVCDSLWQPK